MLNLIIIIGYFLLFIVVLVMCGIYKNDSDNLAEENYELQEENKYLKKLLKNRNEQKL